MKPTSKEKAAPQNVSVKNTEADFCRMWPQAKQTLELLKEIENNPAASLILATVKASGDAVIRKANN